MPQFNALKYAYPSRRNVVFARKGMASSTSPIASQVGLEILKSGGNAVDAAIAMAATMPLVEPTGNGLGSDCFALVWSARDQKLYGLDGSGVAPMALSADIVRAAGCDKVPLEGWFSTMVPGAPSAWAELRRKFGTRSMAELMAPAIQYAREGFCIPVNVYKQWQAEVRRISACAAKEPELYGPWMEYFTQNGEMFGVGATFVNPDYARTLESLAATDCESYYRGELMERIVAFSRRTGGFFDEGDFQSYHARWVEPISVDYKGYTVCEMPPNGHGITALMALNILKGMDLSDERDCADTYHKTIEAVKLAFADTKKFVADPRYMRTKVSDMLSDRYAGIRRALIGDQAVYPEAGDPSCGGTVYFCTADGDGNMVSFIQSNYNCFGSGIVIPGTAITLQDRGANFSLDPESDNCLEGGKKSYHTIIPGFLCKDGKAVGPFGVMGGFMQPQGHVQVVMNYVDFRLDPQQALDAPRWQWMRDNTVTVETRFCMEMARKLQRLGHDIRADLSTPSFGRGQMIVRLDNGVLVGGTESRTDSNIACF